MASIKLYYFDIRGRAELTRLVLALAGQDYQDVRFSFEEWPKYKPDAPFGQAPFVEINGQKFAQSDAIVSYFAREKGLYGETNLETLRISEVLCLAQDIWMAFGKGFSEKDETKKAELDKKLVEEDFPRLFGCFQKRLKENSPNGVFVGKKLTVADLCAYDIMFSMKKVKNYDAAAAFPELKELQAKVEANANIKAYLAGRKDTNM